MSFYSFFLDFYLACSFTDLAFSILNDQVFVQLELKQFARGKLDVLINVFKNSQQGSLIVYRPGSVYI